MAVMPMPGLHTFGGKAAIAEAHDGQATCTVHPQVTTTWTSALLPEALAALKTEPVDPCCMNKL